MADTPGLVERGHPQLLLTRFARLIRRVSHYAQRQTTRPFRSVSPRMWAPVTSQTVDGDCLVAQKKVDGELERRHLSFSRRGPSDIH